MSENTYNVTGEDIRKNESKVSQSHAGYVPKDSDTSAMKSIISEKQESKQEKIDRVQANLPLPDDPPGPSDFNTADSRSVNVGSGAISEDISTSTKGSSSGLRGPATAESSVRVDGEELKTNTAP